jgi:hypothetical protein
VRIGRDGEGSAKAHHLRALRERVSFGNAGKESVRDGEIFDATSSGRRRVGGYRYVLTRQHRLVHL